MQRGVSIVGCLLLVRTTVEEEPHHLEMALAACNRQRGTSKSTVRRPILATRVEAALYLIALHCIGIGAVVEKPLHRHQIVIPAQLNEIQCCWLGGGPGGARFHKMLMMAGMTGWDGVRTLFWLESGSEAC